MRRVVAAMLALALAACGATGVVEPTAPVPLPAHPPTSLDAAPPAQARRRMVPPEAFLRAYLAWFGGLAPLDVRKRGGSLFEDWQVYLSALGLPDYAYDFPRATQSNPVLLATHSALGEALCVRAAEHDLHHAAAPLPLAARLVFKFDAAPDPSLADFTAPFDTLHRMFLGYPAALAPADRVGRFYALYREVASAHPTGALTAAETGWVAVCAALVVHPEAELY